MRKLPNMLKQGWLIKQIDLVKREVEAWPEWMRDPKVRMPGIEQLDETTKPHALQHIQGLKQSRHRKA